MGWAPSRVIGGADLDLPPHPLSGFWGGRCQCETGGPGQHMGSGPRSDLDLHPPTLLQAAGEAAASARQEGQASIRALEGKLQLQAARAEEDRVALTQGAEEVRGAGRRGKSCVLHTKT